MKDGKLFYILIPILGIFRQKFYYDTKLERIKKVGVMATSSHYQCIHLECLTKAATTLTSMINYGEYRKKPTGSPNRGFHGQLNIYQ
jgi:hypothetical protein